MNIKSIVPILKVKDIDKAIYFYREILGFKIVFRYSIEEKGPHYAGISINGRFLHLSTFPGDGPRGSVIYINVDDVDNLYSRIKTNGLNEVRLEPTNQSWGQREIYVNDQDGNELRFGSSIENNG